MFTFRSNGRRGFLKTIGGAVAALAAAGNKASAVENEVNEVITAATFIRGIEGKEQELEAHLLSLSTPTRAGLCDVRPVPLARGEEPLLEARGLGQPRGSRSSQGDSSHSSLVRKAPARGMDDGDHRLETGWIIGRYPCFAKLP